MLICLILLIRSRKLWFRVVDRKKYFFIYFIKCDNLLVLVVLYRKGINKKSNMFFDLY